MVINSGTRRCAELLFASLFGIAVCVPLSLAAPGDSDDDGIPDSIETDMDIDNDGIADFNFLTEAFFSEDFGTGIQVSSPYTSYLYQPGDTIQDGEYAVVDPGTRGEYWLTNYSTISEDHTPSDIGGRAFAVNGAFEPGEFFRRDMTGLLAGAGYVFSAWVQNTQPTGDILPNVRFSIVDSNALELASYESGDITGSDWIQVTMVFESSDGADISLILANNAPGGIGNDLLLDDIEFQVGFRDVDDDGIADYLDSDSDNDGIDDIIEGLTDSDSDGLANSIDTDSDNDGRSDQLEGQLDVDGNGIADYLDPDFAVDQGLADATDSDNDRVPDSVEGMSDHDLDGVPNHLDTDSDNDGIEDRIEAAMPGSDPAATSQLLELSDVDGDGIADLHDRDSDNDGLTDTVETLGTDGDRDRNGIIDNFVDTNNNGTDDGLELVPLTTPDTDQDGLADYRDADSDNDGRSDTAETGWGDFDGDGIIDQLADENLDGLADSIILTPQQASSATGLRDSDANGVPDVRQGLGLAAALPDAEVIQVGLKGRGCAVLPVGNQNSKQSRGIDPLFGMLLLLCAGQLLSRFRTARSR